MTHDPGGPAAGDEAPHRTVYGRRRGRKFRVGQQALYEGLLPRLAVDLPKDSSLVPADLFERPVTGVWLEIGFGGGEHLVAQAEANPDIGFIGCDYYENGVVKLLAEIDRRHLDRVRLLVDDARLLMTRLPDASIDRAFILFPDPWPKLRHHRRRIIQTATLDLLARILKDGAELRVATDDRDYLVWILQRVTTHPDFAWLAERPGDWRARPADWPPTRYEQKAIAAGRAPAFLRLTRGRRFQSTA